MFRVTKSPFARPAVLAVVTVTRDAPPAPNASALSVNCVTAPSTMPYWFAEAIVSCPAVTPMVELVFSVSVPV